MTILSTLKKWYFDIFLPFENPDHPLNTSHQPDSFHDELSDWIEAELDAQQENPYIGPNYARKPFSKSPTYEKWGDKWYKKY